MTGGRLLIRRILIGLAVTAYTLFVVGSLAYSYLLMERTVNMATGPITSYSNDVGRKLDTWLKDNGVSSNLIVRENSLSVIEEVNAFGEFLQDPNDLNLGFVAQGVDASRYPDVVSLGSIASLPLLIFARSELDIGDLAGKKVSIGVPGSDVNHLMTQIIDSYGFTSDLEVRSDPTDVGVEQLLSGDVDAVAILDSLRAPIIAELAGNPDLKIVNLARNAALAFEIGYIQPATIPASFIDLAKRLPAEPVSTVAVDLTVIANKYLDEPNVLLIAEQLTQLDSRMRLPSDVKSYPNTEGSQFPISAVAREYYINGIPLLYKIFPDSLIAWLWIPLARVVTVTFFIWAALRYVFPFISNLTNPSGISRRALARLERRQREGKPLSRRQTQHLKRVVAAIEVRKVDPDQETMERALSLLGQTDSVVP
jgi:TRAP-type uncharacterized transport system substrate-binding protein